MKKVSTFRNNYTRYVVILLFLCCSDIESNNKSNKQYNSNNYGEVKRTYQAQTA